MDRLWLTYFFAAIGAIGSIGVAASSPFLLIGRSWRPARRIGEAVFERGVRFLLRCQPWLAADVRIRIPKDIVAAGGARGALLVSNHRSTLDVFFLLAYVPGVRILAKRALARVPFLGAAMRLTRQVFVDTGKPEAFADAMRTIEAGLAAGEAMHVFPELTRCPAGFAGTQRFSVAPFRAAMSAGVPVVPIVFENTDAAWPKGRYGLRFRRRVSVRSLPPLDPRQFASVKDLAAAAKATIDAALGGAR